MELTFVLGGGFGLYGHTPALLALGVPVATLSRYRATLLARPELCGLANDIVWMDGFDACDTEISATVLAQRPLDNEASVRRLLANGTGGKLVLEKPMAASWEQACQLEDELSGSGRTWCIPYLFLHCDWFTELKARVSRGESQYLRWTHAQSPLIRKWKSNQSEGGGIVSFYFIHLLAVLEDLGSFGEFEVAYDVDTRGNQVSACMTSSRQMVRLELTLESTSRFEIANDDEAWFASETPFGPIGRRDQPDPRLPALMAFYGRNLLRDTAHDNVA